MKKFVVGTVSALALLGLAACSDTDQTTTQSVPPAVDAQPAPAPMQPAPDAMAPTPDAGTGADTQMNQEPAPAEPAPAQ